MAQIELWTVMDQRFDPHALGMQASYVLIRASAEGF